MLGVIAELDACDRGALVAHPALHVLPVPRVPHSELPSQVAWTGQKVDTGINGKRKKEDNGFDISQRVEEALISPRGVVKETMRANCT